MSYHNPFPASDGPIGENLFVGRSDIIQGFQEFISRNPNDRRNEVWIVAGDRGQGKSSLVRKLATTVAGSRGDCACACFEWKENHNAAFPLARELYGSIVKSRKDGQWIVPLFRGGIRYHLGNLLPFASYSAGGASVSLKHLVPKPRNGSELVTLLVSNLHDKVGTVVFMIDEVSIRSEASVEPGPAADKTKVLANSVRNTPLPEGRGLNILTMIFVQPQDVRAFDARIGGPRSWVSWTLEDFLKTDIEDLIQSGVAASNVHARQQGLPLVSAEMSPVAAAVEDWVGGVPTLTVALLHDAFEKMKKRVEQGEPPELKAADVEDCIKDGNFPLVKMRIGQLVRYFQMPTESRLQAQVRRLLGAFAEEEYGPGGWQESELRSKMREIVGNTSSAKESIEVCIRRLVDSSLLIRSGNELRFRCRLAMNHLVELL